jgi:hypothetical protein
MLHAPTVPLTKRDRPVADDGTDSDGVALGGSFGSLDERIATVWQKPAVSVFPRLDARWVDESTIHTRPHIVHSATSSSSSFSSH